jgi:hypothetical protein
VRDWEGIKIQEAGVIVTFILATNPFHVFTPAVGLSDCAYSNFKYSRQESVLDVWCSQRTDTNQTFAVPIVNVKNNFQIVSSNWP